MANHSAQSHQIQSLVKQVIDTLDPDVLYDLYGIEVDTDGSVYDTVYDKSFPTVACWARFSIEMDEIDDADFGYSGPNEFAE